MASNLRWGILTTGTIARVFAQALGASTRNRLVAVASRSAATAQAFADDFALDPKHCHPTYESLLEDSEVDAIYIATPHPGHAAWTIRALQAGKAVLCEKPLGINHAECMAMVEAAHRNNAFLMEAFMYRLHPQTRKIQTLVAEGAIGEVRHIQATFGFHAPFDAQSRLFAADLAGGGILDVGCYPMSFARMVVGTEPLDISAHGHLGQTGVDEWSSALLKFDNGVSAQIATSVSLELDNSAVIYGSAGQIRVSQPWHPNPRTDHWSFELARKGMVEQISGDSAAAYVLEADHVAEQVAAKRTQSPLLSWQDTLSNALALDRWRSEIGLSYPAERPETHPGPILGNLRPASARIQRASVEHLQTPVARLVMGCDNQPSMSHASVMWDDYFEAGGNCFDTAHIYGDGLMETLLGHWHSHRGVRDDMVIIGKGAHTPNNFPHYIGSELDRSTERLRTDHVDIYFLHRDNLEVPVGEFVDVLNEEVRNGRIRTLGASNWSLERLKAANDYAAANNLQGFSAVSNNFSLARMAKPIWPGTQTCDTPEFLTYLQETQIALMPWSSQARGFFTPWAARVIADSNRENPQVTTMQPTVEELKRVWFSDENFERRERAEQIAARYGVELINVALAYVLRQPFPTFPLIGPRLLAETASCIASLELELSEQDIRFLQHG